MDLNMRGGTVGSGENLFPGRMALWLETIPDILSSSVVQSASLSAQRISVHSMIYIICICVYMVINNLY